jgi:hypothetical protein
VGAPKAAAVGVTDTADEAADWFPLASMAVTVKE